MAFNNFLSPVWVGPGQSISWWYTFHDNRGAQYAMANCLTPDSHMETIGEGNQLNENGTVTYYVSFTNKGAQACLHNLNGGGLS